MTASGDIITGANVENALYGAGICAERVAITRCLMEGHNVFKAIAVAADDTNISPCGICRQFIREFSTDVPVVMLQKDGSGVVRTLGELLPMSFGPDDLARA